MSNRLVNWPWDLWYRLKNNMAYLEISFTFMFLKTTHTMFVWKDLFLYNLLQDIQENLTGVSCNFLTTSEEMAIVSSAKKLH